MLGIHERGLVMAKGDKAKLNRERWIKYWQRGLDLIERAEQQAEKQKQERA